MLMSPGAAAAPQARDRERGGEEGKRGGLGCGAVAQLEEDVLTGASGLRKTRGVADDQERVVALPSVGGSNILSPRSMSPVALPTVAIKITSCGSASPPSAKSRL